MILLGSARLFGGKAPSTGEQAELFLAADALEVRSAHEDLRAPVAALRVREVGSGPVGLELTWDGERGPVVIHVFDADALRALQSQPALAAASQFQALRAGQRRAGFARTLGWGALALFLGLPLLLFAAFLWQADRIASAAASRIPIEQEIRLGREAFASMRANLDLVETGRAHAVVQNLGARLTRDSRYDYQFHVARDASVNAFALPGGVIVIHTGLIEATRSPEELAGVLAHELEHIEQRHSLEALIKDLGLRGLWLLATGDVGGGMLGQAALRLTSLTFSREAERQADAAGFDALVAAGIDPTGMVDFFRTLSEAQGAAPPALLSTHPASEAREQALRARLTRLGGRRFEPLGITPWPPLESGGSDLSAFIERFQRAAQKRRTPETARITGL